jgi:hypothetical protein
MRTTGLAYHREAQSGSDSASVTFKVIASGAGSKPVGRLVGVGPPFNPLLDHSWLTANPSTTFSNILLLLDAPASQR